MRVLILFFIFLISWFCIYIIDSGSEDPNNNNITIVHDYLFDDNSEDGHWEYLTEFKSKYTARDKHCLQQNIFFEAATENLKGKVAVAMVTLNRVKSKKFPNTVCEVVRQAKLDNNGFPIKGQCQFSWYCDGLSDKPKLSDKYTKKVWDQIGYLVNDIIEQKYDNPVGRSTHYHSKKVQPEWSNHFYVHSEIGSHIFYVRGL